jgi:hypothetical protein
VWKDVGDNKRDSLLDSGSFGIRRGTKTQS